MPVTVGQPTIDIQVPLNGSSFSYFVQGVENTSGTPTITASASGYTNATTTVTVGPPGFDILGLPGTTTTLSANDPFLIRLGSRNVGNTGLAAEQAIRAGGTALTATITNSNATRGPAGHDGDNGATGKCDHPDRTGALAEHRAYGWCGV